MTEHEKWFCEWLDRESERRLAKALERQTALLKWLDTPFEPHDGSGQTIRISMPRRFKEIH